MTFYFVYCPCHLKVKPIIFIQGDAFLPHSNHYISCNAATQISIQKRYSYQCFAQEHLNINHVESQSDQDQYIVVTNEDTVYHAQCAWNHKFTCKACSALSQLRTNLPSYFVFPLSEIPLVIMKEVMDWLKCIVTK